MIFWNFCWIDSNDPLSKPLSPHISVTSTSLLTNCEAISKDIDECEFRTFQTRFITCEDDSSYIFTRVAEYKVRNKSVSDYITWHHYHLVEKQFENQ